LIDQFNQCIFAIEILVIVVPKTTIAEKVLGRSFRRSAERVLEKCGAALKKI
jgi:hypothetical protein